MSTAPGRTDDRGTYDAFISYAWDPTIAPPEDGASPRISDATIARRLRHSLLTLATPRTRRSSLAIYLDKVEQRPTHRLWEEGILKNLAVSRLLIVVCSPRSAESPGVQREVEFWLDSGRDLSSILV